MKCWEEPQSYRLKQSRSPELNWPKTHKHSLCSPQIRFSQCKIPGMAEPGGLLSMGSHRVGNDWSDLAAAAAAVHNSYDAGFGKTPPSFLYSSRGSHSKNTGEVCHNFLQWTMFGQSSPYDPSILSGPAHTSWLIASLSYSSTFPWQGSDWCWRRFLRVTWTARRSNQSI